MRRVEKRSQPPSELLQYVKSSGASASFDGFPTKGALRTALLEDQRFLCCYCMRRIDTGRMKIEHLKPQSLHRALELHWQNLLGACDGNEGQPPRSQTCDTRKGSVEITLNPLADMRARYLGTGKLEFGDPVRQREADDVLNLNAPHLVRARASALDALKAVLTMRLGPVRTWTQRRLDGELQRYRAEPKLAGYFGVIEYWLEKRIRRG